MVPNVTTIVQRFTTEWAALLQPEAILTVCREIGYTTWRDRVLLPVTTIQLFLQILHGNTACSHLPHLSGLRFSAAAYCQARAKLPLRFFDLLLERFGSAVPRPALDEGRWQGHRTFLVDGSGCSIFAIVYNLVRLVMGQSAALQHVSVEQISFLDALRWLSAPNTGMPLMAFIVNPAPLIVWSRALRNGAPSPSL